MENTEVTLNRQALRSIASLQEALVALMQEQPFQKITITDLAERSGLTRSTFYAHFDTKEELLSSILNEVLDEFFAGLKNYDPANPSTDITLESNREFFRLWKKNSHLLPMLETLDFSCLMAERLRAYWERLFESNVEKSLPAIPGTYTKFTTNFLAVAFTGFLREWFQQGLQPSADVMGEMVYHFAGPPALISAREKFRDRF